jgi:hypothetical protein
MTTPIFSKRIDPVFETTGKRRKLVGFDGWLDDLQCVFCAANYAEAENALDELALDLLVREADLDAEIDAVRAEAA